VSKHRSTLLLALACVGGCSRPLPPAEPATAAERQASWSAPEQPALALWGRRVVATRLVNPRGMLELADGSLLVAEAGVGDPGNTATGRVLRLTDANHDGDFDDPGERQAVADRQPSVNILRRLAVNRDEVFGLADIEAGAGMIVATVADPTTGSTLLRLDQSPPVKLATTRDNANSIAWHPKLGRWYAVQSFANTVIEIGPDGATRDVAAISALEKGQHSVPAALLVDAGGSLLVALFSGQLGGDTEGTGVDFVQHSGKVVRVDPTSGKVENAIEHLNAPTDLALSGNELYVLEFCREFRDPVRTVDEATSSVRHAGFERYSGRVLRVDLETKQVSVIAQGLDLPTHLRVKKDGNLLVTEGMGTPGRVIPGPTGPVPLEGRLVELSAPK
jgi:sugar lactone lactonase YvrE